MPTAQLPLETILQVVEASLRADADAVAATQSHFEQLRLVNKAVKQQAHRSYPQGIADLAGCGASVLLDHTPPSEWSTKLEEVAPVLRITTQLAIVRKIAKPRGKLYLERGWSGGVQTILGMCHGLQELSVDCAEDGFTFGGLALQQCSALQALRITNGWKDQLHGLDLMSMGSLRSFSMTSPEPYYDMDEALDFRLPSQLATLELHWLGLTAADVAALAPSLHSLEELEIWDDLDGGQVEATQLPQMNKLRKLVLYGKMTQGAMREVSKCGELEELDLSNNTLGSIDSLRLHENTSIRILNLSGNRLSDPASLGLASNRSLVELDAGYNRFNSLLFGLEQNSTLRTLDISHNDHVATHISQLSEQLSHNTTLTTLHLQHCRINDVAIQELHLERSSGLRSLDLRHNYAITDEGLKPLVESIEKHGLQARIMLEKTGVSAELRARFA